MTGWYQVEGKHRETGAGAGHQAAYRYYNRDLQVCNTVLLSIKYFLYY